MYRPKKRPVASYSYGMQNQSKVADALELPDDVSEEQIQQCIITELRALGYEVLQNTVRYKKITCPKCGNGFYDHTNTGQSSGVPDLSVRSSAWPPYMWIGLEVKKKKNWRFSSDEQRRLVLAGAVVKVHSVREALDTVKKADDWFNLMKRGFEFMDASIDQEAAEDVR